MQRPWFSVIGDVLLLRNVVGFEKLVQPLDTSFLLVDVRMNVEIESSGDIRVPEYYTYGFIITSTFDAPGGESVTQSMKYYRRNLKTFDKTAECLAVGTRFFGFSTVPHNIVAARLLTLNGS